jgi:hypothetical protein
MPCCDENTRVVKVKIPRKRKSASAAESEDTEEEETDKKVSYICNYNYYWGPKYEHISI